jgi:hypothetical protein
VSGLAFGLIYLRRRSGLEAATSHAFADVLGVIAATLPRTIGLRTKDQERTRDEAPGTKDYYGMVTSAPATPCSPQIA